MTDDDGRFEFRALPAGRFTIAVMHPDHVAVVIGSTHHPGTPITLIEGQQLTDLTVRLARGARITGRLVDDRGQPVVQRHVAARVPLLVNGHPVFDAGSIVSGATTDDRGFYQLRGLPAGSYLISTEIPPPPFPLMSDRVTPLRVFCPGTRDVTRAVTISVIAGEERDVVDFVLGDFR